MSLLIDLPPETVEIEGEVYPIQSGFRTSILFETMMLDPSLSPDEKMGYAFSLYYPKLPPNLDAGLNAIMDFYRCGKPERKGGKPGGGGQARVYSFEQDDGYIYAAFLQQYQIDLSLCEMHWWKFKALFQSLSPDTLFCKIMGWRAAKTDGKMPAAERNRLRELKELYALERPKDDEEKVEEIRKMLMGG